VSSLCLAHHAVRLWCSLRRWPRGATNPVQIRWKSHQRHSLPTQDYGEPKRELCHHYGDRLIVNSIYKVCQRHGLLTQDYGEPKRELCHHNRHGDQPLVDSI